MHFTYAEIARLNRMVGIALMSGRVEFDDVSESIYKKIADEITRRNVLEGNITESEVRER